MAGRDAWPECLLHLEPAEVVLPGPADLADRADEDEADLERRFGAGKGCRGGGARAAAAAGADSMKLASSAASAGAPVRARFLNMVFLYMAP